MNNQKPVKLSEYKKYDYLIHQIELDFNISEDNIVVTNNMIIEPITNEIKPLTLHGVDLNLMSVYLNEKILQPHTYLVSDESLTILHSCLKPFSLRIKNKINPYVNTSLEGLYHSDGMLVTQCEAEGFRRITYHPDRPDILSKFRVRIEADLKGYPVLLSNGNLLKNNILASDCSRHEAIWEDPYPKPSYLFALVAGKLNEVNDEFIRRSGEKVSLRLHVEHGDEKYTHHAIESLKKAMTWDEQVYGLQYDLDEYNIVAVRHFNMGAMENKSLNIFNSKLILADKTTATDDELERIESVVAHEYFHNWTGNRITCRDWFQLSLKEGLTVFRDQSFTEDLHSKPVKRVQDVSMLRNLQFREDSGPTSHAVKPIEYYSIDNFYTTTIYEKGAELIRMLQTILGKERFMKGISLYFERFDGLAATTEDFLKAISDGSFDNGAILDFSKFNQWYFQPGTPKVLVSRDWNAQDGKLIIRFQQEAPQTSSPKNIDPLVIPIKLAVINSKGRLGKEHLFLLDKVEDYFVLEGLSKSQIAPTLSIFRGFSAPVKWDLDLSIQELFLLYKYDDDHFSRWDAGQFLMRKCLLERASDAPNIELEEQLVGSFSFLIERLADVDLSILSTLLTLPGLSELELCQKQSDPISLFEAKMYFESFLGERLSSLLHKLLAKTQASCLDEWPNGQAARKMTGLAWRFLAVAGDNQIRTEALQAVEGNSMTLARYALHALHPIDCSERDNALKAFYERWKSRPLILDTWFSLEASKPRENALQQVEQLLTHSLFDPVAPNAIRAVLGGFASNTKAFHAQNGNGYKFMVNQILEVDRRNPITASRLVKVFSRWKTLVPQNSKAMSKALKILTKSELSVNTREIVNSIISG